MAWLRDGRHASLSAGVRRLSAASRVKNGQTLPKSQFRIVTHRGAPRRYGRLSRFLRQRSMLTVLISARAASWVATPLQPPSPPAMLRVSAKRGRPPPLLGHLSFRAPLLAKITTKCLFTNVAASATNVHFIFDSISPHFMFMKESIGGACGRVIAVTVWSCFRFFYRS